VNEEVKLLITKIDDQDKTTQGFTDPTWSHSASPAYVTKAH